MPVIRLVQPKSPTTVDVPYLSTRAPGANTESVTQTKARDIRSRHREALAVVPPAAGGLLGSR